jgi:hypothetical protein
VVKVHTKKEFQMDGLTVGRIVHYVLTVANANEINRRRVPGVGYGDNWPVGAQAHVGNVVGNGEHVPMIIVATWPGEFPDGSGINGQAFLDGNDSLWVASVRYSEEKEPGTWHWIEKA